MTSQKIAIVTGASRGIGAATALTLAHRGYAIGLNYLSDAKAADDLAAQILDIGVPCVTVKADVSNEQQVSALFNKVDETLGAVSLLVNNVGILKTQCSLDAISAERFSEVMRVNVMSCFLCSKEAIKRMSIKRGGSGGCIVNVSSMAAKTGSPNEYVDYAASKGAIDSMTRGMAIETADEGIRVNAVRPGLIETDIHRSGGEPNRVERLKSKIPLQRGGKPNEVAEAIAWLASDASSFVTGSFIDIAGGW